MKNHSLLTNPSDGFSKFSGTTNLRIFRGTEFVYSFLCTINLYNTFGSFCVSIKCISILVYELCCTIMKIMVEILHGCWPAHLKKGRPTLHSAAYRSNFLVLIAAFIVTVIIAVRVAVWCTICIKRFDLWRGEQRVQTA